MPNVLAAGFSERSFFALQPYFQGVPIKLARTDDEVLGHLRDNDTTLLVIEHSMNSDSSMSLIGKVRSDDAYKKVPILYCLGKGVDQETAQKITLQIGVGKLAFHPVDWEKVSSWVNSPPKNSSHRDEPFDQTDPITDELKGEGCDGLVDRQRSTDKLDDDTGGMTPAVVTPIWEKTVQPATSKTEALTIQTNAVALSNDDGMGASHQESSNTVRGTGLPIAKSLENQNVVAGKMASLWEKFKGGSLDRVAAIENSVVALLKNEHTEDALIDAQRDAHKLAGSLGTFGFAEGSRIAKDIELILEAKDYANPTNVYRLSELAVALRDEVEGAESGSTPASEPSKPPDEQQTKKRQVLVIESSEDLGQQIVIESMARGLLSEQVRNISSVRDYLSQSRPDAVILNLAFSGNRKDALELLADFKSAAPPIPCIVLGPTDNFDDRIEVVRLGGLQYLSASTPPKNIVDNVETLVQQAAANATANILAIDDDPQMLEILRSILAPQGINVETLDAPEDFWNVLEKVSPDLVLLDLDMPNISGFDLCRVMRSDSRWRTVPVVFVTANSDEEAVQKIFEAGADDYVTKPVAGPELIARILNRLERIGSNHTSKTHPITGMATRDSLENGLLEILNLADRYQQPAAFAVMIVDRLDEFSKQYGRDAKNKALNRLGELLNRKFRGQNIAGHWDDNELVIGIYGSGRREAVNRVSEAIEMFMDTGRGGPEPAPVQLALSAGVSEYPTDGMDMQTLYAMASEAHSVACSSSGQKVVAFGEQAEYEQEAASYDVVLVDDDEVLAELLLHTIETKGYKAYWIKDGYSAVKLLGGEVPEISANLVLMDVDMPGLSGLNALRQLASENFFEQTRVIMLTARSIESETLTALELGAIDHITKPFSLPVLMQRIRRAMES